MLADYPIKKKRKIKDEMSGDSTGKRLTPDAYR
jgi:hypothetical protein